MPKDPNRCDPQVANHGTPVLMTHTIPKSGMDDWCDKVEEAVGGGAQIDWHYFAGRIVVRAIGNLDLIRGKIKEHLPLLGELQRAEYERPLGSETPSRWPGLQIQFFD